MGQAQSQSTGGDCGDCFGAFGTKTWIIHCIVLFLGVVFDGFVTYLEGRNDQPDPLKSVSSSSNGYPQTQASTTGIFDGGYRPSQSGGDSRPGQSRDFR